MSGKSAEMVGVLFSKPNGPTVAETSTTGAVDMSRTVVLTVTPPFAVDAVRTTWYGNHCDVRPTMAGPAPHGAVVYGSARKPPPIVVPAINAAHDKIDEVLGGCTMAEDAVIMDSLGI